MSEPNQVWWLIEMQGPAYLGVQHSGGYHFFWTEDVNKALRLMDEVQADLLMMAIRELRPELFPTCLPRRICATQHMWIPGQGVTHL
jgi:hypothetical protein